MGTTDNRCATCCHRIASNGKSLCLAMKQPKPIDYMRTEGECGPEARLFDPPGLEDLELEYS